MISLARGWWELAWAVRLEATAKPFHYTERPRVLWSLWLDYVNDGYQRWLHRPTYDHTRGGRYAIV